MMGWSTLGEVTLKSFEGFYSFRKGKPSRRKGFKDPWRRKVAKIERL